MSQTILPGERTGLRARIDGACVARTIPETAGVIVAVTVESRDFPTCF